MTGRDLKERRLSVGLTQKQAAEFLGVNRETICNWEMGKLKLSTMVEIAYEHFAPSQRMLEWIYRQDPKLIPKILRRQMRYKRQKSLLPDLSGPYSY